MLAEREKKGLLLSGKEPADLYVVAHRHRQDYAFDVTVISPCQTTMVQKAAQYPLLVAQHAVNAKYEKYAEDIRGQPWKLQPLAFEATGGMDKPVMYFIRDVARMVAARRRTRWQIEETSMIQEMSVILARSGADMVLRKSWMAGT